MQGGPETPDRAEGTSDPARDDSVKFGAGGGWFRLWGSRTVFFFTHQWPDDQVAACNIGELEMMRDFTQSK